VCWFEGGMRIGSLLSSPLRASVLDSGLASECGRRTFQGVDGKRSRCGQKCRTYNWGVPREHNYPRHSAAFFFASWPEDKISKAFDQIMSGSSYCVLGHPIF
jgi:hypothetical protein